MIHNIWVIHKESGRNVFAKMYGKVQIDKDLLSGFLTAVFSFAESEVKSAGVESIVMGGLQWLYDYHKGLLFIIAADKSDDIELLRGQLDIVRDSFLEKFSIFKTEGDKAMKFLRRWNGSPKAFKEFQDMLDDYVGSWKTATETAWMANKMDFLEVLQHVLDEISATPIPMFKKPDQIAESMQKTIDQDPNLNGLSVQADLKLNILAVEKEISREDFLESMKRLNKVEIGGLKELTGLKKLQVSLNTRIVQYLKRDWRRIKSLDLADFIIKTIIV